MKVLVTGGAGYIGSHVARHLGEAGHDIISFDNLSTGNESAVLCGDLVVGDLKNTEDLDCLFDLHAFDAVLHFAASIVVPDSVTAPLDYYENNVRSTLNLLRAVEEYGVDKFVFSSSAAVYGLPDGDWVEETSPLRPINPYGWTKLMGEQMLQDLSKSSKVRYVILRYFNVAGADPDGRIGQSTPNATHLIKLACKAATGSRDGLSVFGNDYETPDGTCIRDYIHVDDLAAAHCLSLDYLVHGGTSDVFNCGYGSGKSVLEVIEMVKKVSVLKL